MPQEVGGGGSLTHQLTQAEIFKDLHQTTRKT